MTNVVSLNAHKKKKKYPTNLPESERQELIECGYDPDNPEDVKEYWEEIETAADLLKET